MGAPQGREWNSPYVRSDDGVQIYYEVSGEGYPLVFIHGFLGLLEHWQDQIPVFSRRYRVIAHDLRGMGRSDKPFQDVYTIAQDADDLDAVITATQAKRAALVGHSKGGAVAMQYCLKHPDKVSALVLVNSFAKGSHLPAVDEAVERDELSDLVKREQYCVFSFGKELREKRPDTFRWVIHEGLKMPTHATVAIAKGFRRHWDAFRLERIRVPTLLVWGDADNLTRLEPSQNYILRKISGSKLVKVAGAGHAPMLHDPQRFNNILSDFLTQCQVH